jgi:hypothetical protein
MCNWLMKFESVVTVYCHCNANNIKVILLFIKYESPKVYKIEINKIEKTRLKVRASISFSFVLFLYTVVEVQLKCDGTR